MHAITLCFVAITFGWLADAEPRSAWLLAGGAVTILLEVLAYQRAEAVRSLFERPQTAAVATAIGGTTIGAGAILAPDRSLSVAVGALATYLLLLGISVAAGWSHDGADAE